MQITVAAMPKKEIKKKKNFFSQLHEHIERVQ